jgi:hypothetical protein
MVGMSGLEAILWSIAAAQQSLVTRRQVHAAGGTDADVKWRLQTGRWRQIHPGVYLMGPGPATWEQRLMAACLAAGPTAVASHLAAALVWDLDVTRTAPIVITAPHDGEPDPAGAVVHRSRQLEPADRRLVRGIPVNRAESVLVEVASLGKPLLLEKAVHGAARRRLATERSVNVWLDLRSRRGRGGTRALRREIARLGTQRPAGSGGEVEVMALLRSAGVPDPVRQFEVKVRSGQTYFIDWAWPAVRCAAELHGYKDHGDPAKLDRTFERGSEIREEGWVLLDFGFVRVDRRPAEVARSIMSMLRRRGLLQSAA